MDLLDGFMASTEAGLRSEEDLKMKVNLTVNNASDFHQPQE